MPDLVIYYPWYLCCSCLLFSSAQQFQSFDSATPRLTHCRTHLRWCRLLLAPTDCAVFTTSAAGATPMKQGSTEDVIIARFLWATFLHFPTVSFQGQYASMNWIRSVLHRRTEAVQRVTIEWMCESYTSTHDPTVTRVSLFAAPTIHSRPSAPRSLAPLEITYYYSQRSDKR